LMRCRAASKTRKMVAALNDGRAAVREISVTGLVVAVSSVIRSSL
jgi:hypothetical protein